MTRLSVNLNKIALLRNSRGRDYPNVVAYAKRFIDLGVGGITVHPRQDERHTTKQDAYDLGVLCSEYDDVEYNIEGYPSTDFIDMVVEIKPDQCTLVPDDVNQLTSDHGWDVDTSRDLLVAVLERLKNAGIRTALFMDPDADQIKKSATIGADRVELYTEMYASTYGLSNGAEVLEQYRAAALAASESGIEINAGHDLDLNNLRTFLSIPNILEVSIGHALTIECIDNGMDKVVQRYLEICS